MQRDPRVAGKRKNHTDTKGWLCWSHGSVQVSGGLVEERVVANYPNSISAPGPLPA